MSAKIAIIGAGVMGETLLAAFLNAGREAGDVVITEKRAERAAELRERYGVEVLDNADAARGADLILLVVKPQDMPAVLAEMGPAVRPGATVMSLAAGTRIAAVEAAVREGVAVIRVMPNTPALVGEGMFGISPGTACSDAQLAAAKQLLESCGRVAVVPEEQQDAVTAVSGSGPAYVFYLAESMIAGGVAAGLPEETARQLAVQTVIGAARLLAGSDESPDVLRKNVTSPGGTTAAALKVLEDGDVKDTVATAIRAARDRSADLSQ